MSVIINASTSSGLVQTADTSGTLELQSNGTTQLTVSSTGTYGQLKSGTAQASTSGTSIDFTGIPSWVKRITVMFNGISTNGTSHHLIQLGSGSIQTSGYSSVCAITSTGAANTGAISTGMVSYNSGASATKSGAMVLFLVSGNDWVSNQVGRSDGTTSFHGGGNVTLSGTLDRIRITTVNGTDTFDAGSINILYEG